MLVASRASIFSSDFLDCRVDCWTTVRNLFWVTADTLDALGRTEEAKALRERYGGVMSDDSKFS